MVKVELKADATGAIAAVTKTREAVEKFKKEFDGAAKEAEEFGRLITKVMRDSQSPLEKYNRSLADLRTILQAGAISETQFNAAAAKLKETLDNTKVNKESLTIPQSAINSVAQYATAVLSGQAAWRLVQNAVQDAVNESIKAGEIQDNSSASRGNLLLLANDTQDMENLLGMSAKIAGSGAAGTVGSDQAKDRANVITDAIRSADQDSNVDTFIDVFKMQMVKDQATYIKGMAAIQKSYGGDMQSLISQSIQANAKGTANLEDISRAASSVGTITKRLGGNFAQNAAATTVGMDVLPNQDFEQRYERLLISLDKKKIGKGTPLDRVRQIGAKMKSDGLVESDIFGDDSYAIEGFRVVLDNIDKIAAIEKTVAAAADGSKLKEKIKISKDVSSLFADQAKSVAVGEESVQRGPLGEIQQLDDALKLKRDLYEETYLGRGGVGRSLSRTLRSAERTVSRYGLGIDPFAEGESDLINRWSFLFSEMDKAKSENDKPRQEYLKEMVELMRRQQKMIEENKPRREPKLPSGER